MQDPFQSYANQGYSPQGYPSLSPYGAAQAGIHPLAAAAIGLHQAGLLNPIYGVGQAGPQGYGPYQSQGFIHPQQQLQLAALAQHAAFPQLLNQHAPGLVPIAAGFQNPLQNPIMTAALLNHPYLGAALQSQYGGQQFGQQAHPLYSQFGQGLGSPFGQPGLQGGLNSPLAPQSWVGQGGPLGAAGFGQINPLLSQMNARAFQGQGLSPWGYQ